MLDVLAMREKGKGEGKEWLRGIHFLMTIGWYIVSSLLAPTAIGWWLDRPGMWDTHPTYTLIGFGLGTVIAFYGLYQMLRRFQREQGTRESK